jgi:hypothetical protein
MDVKGIQFLSDHAGKTTGVLIDLRRHRRLWEDFYDQMVSDSRRHEPRIPWDEVKRRLPSRRKRRA